MRVDTHQHFWRYTPEQYPWIDASMSVLRRDFLPEELKVELTRAGVDGSIAVQAQHSLEETRWLLDLAEREPMILGVIGWVDLRSADVKLQLNQLAQSPKLLGIRHIVQAEPDDHFLLQPEFLRGVSVLEEFGLSYDILIYPRHLPIATEFVKHFPRQRFVLDHLAKPFIKKRQLQPWESDIRALAENSNVFCKLSGMVTESDWRIWMPSDVFPYVDVMFDAFGPERLMIGSDWPVCTLAGSYAQVMNIVLNYLERFPDTIRDAVLGGNAEKFWNLNSRLRNSAEV
jgi:L-fucono-1,5-lactonase